MVKTIRERVAELKKKYPAIDFTRKGAAMEIPLPVYSSQDEQLMMMGMSSGMVTEKGNAVVRGDMDYEFLLFRLAAVPMKDDQWRVYRAFIEGGLGNTIDDAIENLSDRTKVPREVVTSIIQAFCDYDIIVNVNEEQYATYLSKEVLAFAPPKQEEIIVIDKTVEGSGGRVNIGDLSKQTGIPIKRLREIKGQRNIMRFLVDKLAYEGDHLPTADEVPLEEA